MSTTCEAQFNYIDIATEYLGNAPPCKFLFHYDIAYGSCKDDVAILELKRSDENSPPFPKRFLLETVDADDRKFYIFCHPRGEVLQVDPDCRRLKDEEVKNIMKAKDAFWSKHSDYSREQIAESYTACQDENSFLFHVSDSTNHGASGSPGVHANEKSQPAVWLMYLCGYPKFFYVDYVVEGKKAPENVNDYLLECGIPMKKIEDLLLITGSEAMKKLHENIFAEWNDKEFF